jgi:hypothetical protein
MTTVNDEIASIGRTICKELVKRPQKALRIYQSGITSATTPLVADSLRRRFAKTMRLVEAASKIDTDQGLRDLPEQFAAARRKEQKRLLEAVVDKLAELGAVPGKEGELKRIGDVIPSLALEGTLQRQFFCKLATRLGFQRPVPLPKTVINGVVVPMIHALSSVIRVGAETTRDSAIEGMGALLRLARTHDQPPEVRFPQHVPPDDKRGDAKLNDLYALRLERRRRMVLTVADADWRGKLLSELATPIEPIIAAVRASGPIEQVSREVETVLYERSDLLRVLPAIARQNDVKAEIPRFVDVLCAAAKPLVPLPDDPDSVLIAYARYQESVFRTIDNMIRRDVAWRNFDGVVADAVHDIPRTMTGVPRVCNAQVRATVSILRTAIRVIGESGNSSNTKLEIRPFFEELDAPRPWLNLGIAEACYRGLPDLLAKEIHNDLSEPALTSLFKQLRNEPAAGDLAGAHRHLIVTSCFRRILIALADSVYEQHLDQDVDQATMAESNVEEDLRLLLRHPTVDNVLARFQPQGSRGGASGSSSRTDIHADVIAAVGYEFNLLHNAGTMLQGWKELRAEQSILLTRILASLLHTASRDMSEVARYPRLSAVFVGMSGVAMKHETALGKVWDLLAKLPAEAAEAADPDIQRFVEYRGRKGHGEGSVHESVEDLPGYVLAMISREASDRIAGAIAREIDLNLRHDRDKDPNADFAEPLYQVMLRGPHESIFDHLMPRIERDHDRQMVALFRRHVHAVRHGMERPPRELVDYLRDHVKTLLAELRLLGGPTLLELADALKIFGDLTSEADEHLWQAIEEGKLADFFKALDKLDALVCHDPLLLPMLEHSRERFCEELEKLDNDPNADKSRRWRSLLSYRYSARLTDLQTDVRHYIDLPVRNFAARSATLQNAAKAVAAIEAGLDGQDLLQPPKRILLTALMAHLRDVFERTRRWYCIEAQRYIEENDKDGFWIVFALDTNREAQLAKRISSWFGGSAASNRVAIKQRETQLRIEQLSKAAGSEPPRFRGQTKRFEDFAVDWMASDLDLEALWNALSDRWKRPYQLLFGIVTTPWLAVLAILAPFVWAGCWHQGNVHWLEGLGFWAVAATMVGGALWALVRLFKVVLRERPQAQQEGHKDGYLFRCMLPQLAGFIAAPMALIAKFDHSYEFPLTASPWAMGLLLLLAFVSTRFYLEREVIDRDSSSADMTPRERKKVGKVLGVTLAHAFGIAVLLSVIFADSHHRALLEKVTGGTATGHGTGPAVDEHLRHEPKPPDFMGFLPQQAFLEWQEIKPPHYCAWGEVKEHGNFTYYPTIILSWTALGLFFGLVLEGIGKGEHLRHRASPDSHG